MGRTTTTTYDAMGNPITVKRNGPAPASTLLSSTVNTYSNGELATSTVVSGATATHVTTYTYDTYGNRIRRRTPLATLRATPITRSATCCPQTDSTWACLVGDLRRHR